MKPLRAHCRKCYNERRREHYAIPAVHSEKQRKRKDYQERPAVRQARNTKRRTPEHRAKDKIARDRHRSKPEIAAKISAQKARRLATAEGKSVALLNAASVRARKHGFLFDLDKEWVKERLVVGKCELTGLAFDFGKAKASWNYNPFASIDQIKAGAGYTKGNCRIVIVAINNALSQYGDDLFEIVAKAFLEKRGLKVAH